MRTSHELERATGCGGVVEGDPATHPVDGQGPAVIGSILMEPKRPAARWFPKQVVLCDPRAIPPAEAGARLSDVLA
jgi:hypothetical protein